MSHPEPDELDQVALHPEDAPAATLAHVAGCVTCGADVAALREVAANLRAAGHDPDLVAPPAAVRAQVLAIVDADAAARPAPESPTDPPTPQRRRRGGGLPAWLLAAAAVAVLPAGVAVGRWTAPGEPDTGAGPPAPSVLAATDLATLDGQRPRGTARIVDTDGDLRLRVRAEGLDADEDEHPLHEVWLINVDGERMVSLGLLATGPEADFAVPAGLLEQGYSIVDISAEPDDGDPAHSGTSLARGRLA